ncbi:copper amine oxidase N-terminal domain-containing protein [Desulfothermobacter acidiphilus]|uniref:copper amine oxidase N-terminal domain-containing protein n=1 Tax=Desulfothermobacter acidiphilus TaxID=1938353 RepID=UPI003F8A2A51
MRRLAAVAAAALLVLAFAASPVFAQAQKYPEPYQDGGALMVPLRLFAELNNADLAWNPEAREVVVLARKVIPAQYDDLGFLVRPGRTIERVSAFRAGSNAVVVSGVEIKMPKPAVIRNGRLFVPAEFAVAATCVG